MEEFEKIAEKIVEERKKGIKHFFFSWIQDNYDKLFLAVLALAFAIRLWIFFRTMNQPLWWDEADYLSAAKRWGLGLNIRDIWYYRRGFLFPLVSSLFYLIGFGEAGARVLEVLLSTGFIFVSYVFIAKLFGKKLALFSSIGLALSWILLFFSGRILTDVPAAFFVILSFLLFWEGYVEKKGSKYLYLSMVVFALAALTRMQSLMMAPAFLVMPFLREKSKMFADKKLWIALAIFIVLMIPQFVLYSMHYGNPITDIAAHYLGLGQKAAETSDQRGFSSAIFNYALNLPYVMGDWVFYLFLGGFVYFFADFALGFDKIFRSEEFQKKFFVLFFLACLFLIMGYIGSVSYVEQRYLTVGLPFLFLIAASPLVKLGEFLEKNIGLSGNFSKILAIVFLILLLVPNFMLAKNMTDEKKNSYLEVKEAGLWIRENSNPGDIVISGSLPQTAYYSERSTYPFDLDYQRDPSRKNNETDLWNFVNEKHPKYYVISSFESEPQWTFDFPNQHKNLLAPVKVYSDSNQKPVLAVYEFRYNNSASFA